MDKDFFDNRLLFYGLDELYNKRLLIKSVLATKSFKDVYLYRLYFYSRAFINDDWKDSMWEYLQGDIDELDIMVKYADLQRKQKKH